MSYDLAHWRTHWGRGIFAPYTAKAMGVGDPMKLDEKARMATDPEWPRSPDDTATGPLLALGLEDWGTTPHRIGFLGRPIIDCGHAEDKWHPEIHPPHLLTMDLQRLSSRPSPWQREDGVVWAVFGWVNVTIPGHLEFDVWPPVRPSVDATFVARGYTTELTGPALGPDHGDVSFGFTIDNTGPQAGSEKPTLKCAPAPATYPNHLHCVYEDKAGGPRAPTVDDENYGEGPPGEAHRFARSTPFYATSRFDLRVFVGWSSSALTTADVGDVPHVPKPF